MSQLASPSIHERLAHLRATERLLGQIEAQRRNNGINFYRPHWKQHKFHTTVANGRYGRTGNRFGKTEMGIAEDLAWCLGHRPWYRYAQDIKDGTGTVRESHPGGANHPYVFTGIPNRPVKGILLVVDWDKAHEVHTGQTGDPLTEGKIWKLLPKAALRGVHKSRGGHIERIDVARPNELGGGVSTLKIDTVEAWKHNKMSAESSDYDFIHVDEPLPEPMFKGYQRGLADRAGSFWFTCTPKAEMWMNDWFTPPGAQMIRRADDGKLVVLKVPDENGNLLDVQRYIITGSIYDNPYRSPQGVANFLAGLSRDERACAIDGIPIDLAGIVYREFVYDEHVLTQVPQGWLGFNSPPLDYTVRVAWDVHDALPQAILFAATAPNNAVFFYDEMFDTNLILDTAQEIKRRTWNRNVADLIMDPYAWNPDPRDGSCIADDVDATGLCFEKASKDLTRGLSAVKSFLRERLQNGRYRASFSPHLAQTLFEFNHYIYDPDKGTPKDKHNHMMENLYRLVLNGLNYVPPTPQFDFRTRQPVRAVGHAEDLFVHSES